MKTAKLIIALICLSMLISGCGVDQYSIEREFWHIQKQAGKIFQNPQASPPRELERAVGGLNKFIKRHADNNLAIDAAFTIARLYMVKESHEKARNQLNDIINKYKSSEPICSEAIFLIGNTFEIENKWDSALKQYKKIINDYSATRKGLELPIYIAQYYKAKYQPENMMSAYKEAIGHYSILADKHVDSFLGYTANDLVALCYVYVEDWQGAIRTLDMMSEKYKGKIALDTILFKEALLYRKELKDEAKARELLEKLIKDYPKSRLVKVATEILKEQNK